MRLCKKSALISADMLSEFVRAKLNSLPVSPLQIPKTYLPIFIGIDFLQGTIKIILKIYEYFFEFSWGQEWAPLAQWTYAVSVCSDPRLFVLINQEVGLVNKQTIYDFACSLLRS